MNEVPLFHTHAVRTNMGGPASCVSAAVTYRGTSLIRNSPPPQDHHRALGVWAYCRVLGRGVFT